MGTVARILAAKGHDLWSISPDATVYEAIELMADKGIGALLVMDGDNLVGVVSERDYARKVILQGKSSHDTAVSEIMTSPVVCIRPEDSVEECMALMTNRRIRHLPVLSNGQVSGIISVGDLVKSVISDKDVLIQQLETYIAGGR